MLSYSRLHRSNPLYKSILTCNVDEEQQGDKGKQLDEKPMACRCQCNRREGNHRFDRSLTPRVLPLLAGAYPR